MKRSIAGALALVVAMQLLGAAAAGAATTTGTWRETFGASQPQVGSMIADPRVQGRIWQTTYIPASVVPRDQGLLELFRSDDAGRSWSLVKRGIPGYELALGPLPDTLYLAGAASSAGGLWKS